MTSDASAAEVSVLPLNTSVGTQHLHQFTTLCCGHCGHSLSVPVYCGDRFCPVCSRARRARVRSRLEFLIANVKFKPGENLSHFTLTIKNAADLQEGMRLLVASFRKLRARQFWKRHVTGGAFVLEVTRAENDWHCHIHCIAAAKFLSQRVLSTVWFKCSGANYCYVKRIPKSHAVRYLTKYLSKSEVPEDLQPQVSQELRHYRLFQPFGSWLALNSKWQKPHYNCPDCGQRSWFPLDLLSHSEQMQFEHMRSPHRHAEDNGYDGGEGTPGSPIIFDYGLWADRQADLTLSQ